MTKKTYTSSKGKSISSLFLNKISATYKKSCIIILILFITSFNSFSQSNRSFTIFQRSVYLQSLRTASARNSSSYDKVLDLMDGVQSSIYLTNNQIKTFGAKPVCMYTDLATLGLANNSNLLTSDIEMVTIKLDKPTDLNSPIDLSVVSRYKKVKYIYFRVSFNFELSQLIQDIKNCDSDCIVLYSMEKGA